MRGTIVALLAAVATACGAPALRGIRIHGGADEGRLPILLLKTQAVGGQVYASDGDPFITIEIDLDATIDPRLTLLFVHCSRDWHEDWQYFDDNYMHLRMRDLEGAMASPRVRKYGYAYHAVCPDPSRRVSIDLSGNYKVIVLADDDTLGEARFVAVDPFASVTVSTLNEVDYSRAWRPQVHNIEVNTALAPDIFQSSILGVDIIVDHRMRAPVRVDPEDTSSRVRIDGAGPLLRFTALGQIPGASYRLLDCTNPGIYPPSDIPLGLVPRDIVRVGQALDADNHGAAYVDGVAPGDADYLPIRFRLDANGKRERDVFVVGAFNDWVPDISNQMDFDAYDGTYGATVWLRRGIYDYQYVTGRWDAATRRVVDQSWTELEGNSWYTPRLYTALVYYRDTRYGGIDRVVGCGHN